jgi:hypothetical protein
MAGPGFGHYNFQEMVSNSIQLLCKHQRRHPPTATHYELPLKKRPVSDNSATTPKKSRRVLRNSIEQHPLRPLCNRRSCHARSFKSESGRVGRRPGGVLPPFRRSTLFVTSTLPTTLPCITSVSALMVAIAIPPGKMTNVPPHWIEPSTVPPIARSVSTNASPRRVMPCAIEDDTSGCFDRNIDNKFATPKSVEWQ